MRSFQDIIGLWGTVAAFAADLDVKERTAMSWWQRNSIPADWFAPVVRAAQARSFKGVTADKLSVIAEERRLRKRLQAEPTRPAA